MSSRDLPSARWRGLTAPCGGCGDSILSFDVESDAGVHTVLRLRIDAASIRAIHEVCAPDYLAPAGVCGPCRVQSDRSSGKPQVDGSMPDDGQKQCPPDRSSSAAVGE